MKKLFLLLPLLIAPAPAMAQQTNIYEVCRTYQENYAPGYYDQYGNYVPGNVRTDTYNTRCGTGTYYRPNNQPTAPYYATPVTQPQQIRPRRCNAARTTLGGLLGGGVAAALSKQDAYGWAIPLGAVLGMGVSQSGCE